MKRTITPFICIFFALAAQAQHSVARQWNEQLLHAISGDFARPPVHARNLFHISAAMYDAWAVYSPTADTYFLGKNVHGFETPFRPTAAPNGEVQKAQEEAMSFAAYRLILHRFKKSPGFDTLSRNIGEMMDDLGYNRADTSVNYICGPAAMGNFIAKKVIEYGLQDGSNEAGNYVNQFYKPVNPPMIAELPGNPNAKDLNRWQPLKFATFIDQSGNVFMDFITKFQSAEWGNVQPFALAAADADTYQREGHDFKVYLDPGPPALLDTSAIGGNSEEFKWGMALVSIWGGLLDPADGVKIDASPASIGNNPGLPTNLAGYHDFYDLYEGGDQSQGHSVNPKTGLPYVPQIVPRGDYARVLAEFWADGPLSVTPPGHWFEIVNYVNDQPGIVRKIRGTGHECTPLEWDVKSYFALGGAMHDAAITAWGIKGKYDASRPVTSIRGMADRGQSSDPSLPRFHPGGLPLFPGYIELIKAGDQLEGSIGQHINKIKLRTWRGPNFIMDPKKDVAGTGWIRAENWYPYQRPTFVTPPFAGYVSGHSTYSRAAAELVTALTGDPYFPGGLGTFYCKKNEYLIFEDGPSQDITLQWATYRDASDQCSLSRIFGGIHPPMDDIPGRQLGIKIGSGALAFAEKYFTKTTPSEPVPDGLLFPNPTNCVVQIELKDQVIVPVSVYSTEGKRVFSINLDFTSERAVLDLTGLQSGIYFIVGEGAGGEKVFEKKVVRA